jgi:hypothetical protein
VCVCVCVCVCVSCGCVLFEMPFSILFSSFSHLISSQIGLVFIFISNSMMFYSTIYRYDKKINTAI